MRLSQLVKADLAVDPQIEGVTADSRKVRPGWLFAALPGTQVDGRTFIPAALKAGAAAVLAPDDVQDLSIPVIHAPDLRRTYALAAAAMLTDGDVLVVAGKGHEPGQLVAGRLLPFDDVIETRDALEADHG